jgi:glutaredoxin
MREGAGNLLPASLLMAVLVLGAGLLLLAGCTAAAPAGVPSFAVHVAGNNHGTVLLVGRSSCPHCQATKALLANMNVDYYWVDLDNLGTADTNQVISEVQGLCGQAEYVPILVINNHPPCTIGYNETQIREALK